MSISNERLTYLDSLRAFLMILGIFIHSAQVFNPNGSWLISSSSNCELMVYIIDFIHWFRMPAFFMVSGFFCLISLKKYNFIQFITLRVNRIVIPLVTTALTLNFLQLYIINITFHDSSIYDSYISKAYYLSHLWFLINLLVYFTIALSIKQLAIKFYYVRFYINSLLGFIKVPYYFVFFPLIELSILSLNKFQIPIYNVIVGSVSIYSILTYLPYFLFGLILGFNKDNLNYFSSRNLSIYLTVSIASFYLHTLFENYTFFTTRIISAYFHSLSIYFIICFLFSFFSRFSNKKSNFSYFLADSSYTIYLFHHFLVISFGVVLIKIGTPWYLGYPLLVILVAFSCIYIHKKLILRFKVLRYLFNGKI